jgi:hypothetical protein
MQGVDNLGGADFDSPARRHLDVLVGGTRSHRIGHKPKRGAGLEGAMKMAEDFIRSNMLKQGFIDLRASTVEKIRAYVNIRLSQPTEPDKVDLDPLTASELVAQLGGDVPSDMNLVLRILAQVDPERVAALLK